MFLLYFKPKSCMSINNFLHIESDVITENPVNIPFEWAIRDHIPADEKPGSIVIKPLTVRTWFRIKPLILEINHDDYKKIVHSEYQIPDMEIMQLLEKYDSVLMEILFLGIHNQPGEMSEWYKNALIDNCTWKDIHILLNAILFRIGQQSFSKSIITVRNVSPMTELELIAAQKNLESWKTAQEVQ